MDIESRKVYIPPYIKTALETLENASHEAYLVGGCVRDALLGDVPGDYDITTSATPEEISALFEGEYKLILGGMKHGTVTPIIESHPVEITTFRIDGSYSDNRRPDSVRFSKSLQDDLSRRDFTVNAMAYSEKRGLVDCFGSVEDLKNRTIRCVGSADRRFGEDALRIIRALRFSAVLGFEIEEKTAKSINKNIESIKSVSAERIYTELKKLLGGEFAFRVLGEFPCLLKTLFGLKLSERKLQAIKNENSLLFSFAVIFAGEDEQKLRILKPDNQTLNFCERLNNLLKLPLGEEQKNSEGLALFIYENSIKEDMLIALLKLHSYLDEGFDFSAYFSAFERAKAEELPFERGELNINGDDLKALGFSGKQIKTALDSLCLAAIKGEVKNTRSELIKFAEKKEKRQL